MAEPLSCRESPFAAYLQDLGSPEASLLDASPPSPPAVPRSGAEPYEQVKFTLATSALLSATVEDALELYPTLSTLVQQDTIARTANARHGGAAQGQRAKVTLWPDAWDTVGQTWRDRDTLSNLREALSECVQRLQRLSIADSPGRIAQPLNAAVQAPSSQTRRHDTVEVELLTKVESWVRNAQMLDWTIALAMARLDRRGPVSELLQMSSTPPQTPPRSQASSRVPSHLSSQADQISFQLSKLVTILQQATNQLSSLIPASNAPQLPPKELRSTQRHRTRAGLHGPTASISELQRHASRALQEREEVEQWELGSAASDPSVGLANSAASASVVPPIDRFTRSEGVSRNDPFHPTDTYFGGLERKSSTRSNTSTASGQDRLSTPAGARGHRLRPSVGTVGAFGIGTAAGSGSPSMRDHGGRSRRRPASVGGWIDHTSPVPPSPLARTLGTNDDATNAKDPEGDLQELWDAAHGLRKGFIWTLIAVCEESDIDGKNRQDLGAVLVELVNNLRQIATQIETLRQQSCLEPDCAASSRIGSNAQPPPFRALPSQKLDRNESAISGILAADPTPSAPSLQNHSARRHLGHRSTISLEPHSPPDFGPPSSAPAPTAQALARYESQHVTLSDTLRTLQSSLGSVLSEARLLSPLSPLPLSDSPAVETRNLEARRRLEAVLEKHDTIKEELEKLALEWAESRVTLRQALGIELFKTDPSTQRKMGLGIQAEWETKADILHELGSNDTPPNRPKPEGSSDAALDDGQATPELDLVSRQALLDAALSMSLQPQEREDEREKIFEAVAGEKRDRTPGAEKLSREERIRRMKEGREALDAGKRAASVSEGGGGIAEQQRMVGELRQVLEGREKRRNTEGDPESTSSSS